MVLWLWITGRPCAHAPSGPVLAQEAGRPILECGSSRWQSLSFDVLERVPAMRLVKTRAHPDGVQAHDASPERPTAGDWVCYLVRPPTHGESRRRAQASTLTAPPWRISISMRASAFLANAHLRFDDIAVQQCRSGCERYHTKSRLSKTVSAQEFPVSERSKAHVATVSCRPSLQVV